MNDTIVKQIAGSMALSGIELTAEDQERIMQLMDHPEEKEALLQELIDKHRKEPEHETGTNYNQTGIVWRPSLGWTP